MTDYFWRSHDGLTLHALEFSPEGSATGLPVVCVPGLTRNARDFSNFGPWAASRGHRVLAVSLRGRGRSDRDSNPANYKPQTYARDIIALLDDVGIDRAILVGTSLGGLVTMELAHMAPGRVAAAILNDIGPKVDRDGIARIATYAGSASPVQDWDSAAEYCRHINGLAFPDFTDTDWQRLARWTFAEGPEGQPVPDYDRAIFRPTPRWLMPLVEWHMSRRFRTLATGRPVLVLRGAISDILSASTLARMAATGSDVTTAEIPRVGHAPTLDEPAVLAACDAFFAKVAAV